MAIGRISGSVLKSNLTRNGVDLAFETNLLYLDVTNSRVGIGTSEPTATLHVNGNTNITGNLTGVTDVTASGTTQTDIIKNREQRYTTSNMMKFNQLYTGASSGSYFSANEYQKVVTITPSGDSQNYQVIGRITAQNAGETHVVNFNAALRSNTLPDLNWSIFYDEDYNGSRYIDPQLWTKETTTAGFIFAFKTLATIYGTVTVDFDVIPRTSALLSNVSINTTQDSEQTSVDAGFTARDMTRVVRKQSSNVNINGSVTATSFTGDGSNLTNLPATFGDLTATGSTIISPSNADITLDPAGTGVVRITSNILPDTTETYDIGSTSLRFNDIFLAGTTVDIGGTKISKDANGDIELKDASNNHKRIIASEIHLGDGSNLVKLSRGANGKLKKTDENDAEIPILTVVGDDSSGTDFNTGEDLKIAGAGGITTAMSGDTLTITGPSGTMSNLTDDTTPQLGGNLDLNSSNITGTGNISTTGTLSLTTTTTGDSLLITTTEDSSTAAPVITLKRNSGSPADADYLGQIKFKGENDADQEVVYAKMTGKILDASDGTEDGIIEFAHKKAGANVITARFRSDSFQLLNDTTLVVRNITYPLTDGSAGQFMTTDGSGNLSFATVSTNSISQGDSNVTVTDSGTGAVTIAADGSTIITMNATTVLDASATTNAIRLPNGTTAQRPSGAVGEIRYNSTTDTIEGYTSAGGWAQLGATSSTSENTDDTLTGSLTAISTIEKTVNQFTTGSFDSAWYLAITRDEINDEVATAKYSVAHNDSAAFVSASHIIKEGTNTQITVDADVSGGNVRLKATGTSVVNSTSFYRIALGDNTSASTTGNVITSINTDVDSASEVLDSFAHASYRGAKYYISINNASKTEVSNIEALVVHDGTTAYITSYGSVNTGSNDLLTLTAAINGSNVEVSAAGNEPNLRVTVYKILLGDAESDSSGTNVNVIGATTVSSTATTIDSFSNSTYTGAFYVFTGHNSTEGAASIQEVMVVSNNDVFIGTGPTVSTKGTDQLTFTATQSGSSVTVKAASTSGSSTTVNGYRVHMLRGSGGASTSDTVLVSTTQDITGAKTFDSPIALTVGSDPSSATNKAHIYAKDVSSNAEVFVRDESGNVTQISPHNTEGDWVYYSENIKTGKRVKVNMEKMIRRLEEITGETFFEEYYDPTKQ